MRVLILFTPDIVKIHIPAQSDAKATDDNCPVSIPGLSVCDSAASFESKGSARVPKLSSACCTEA